MENLDQVFTNSDFYWKKTLNVTVKLLINFYLYYYGTSEAECDIMNNFIHM